ncbi:hypothetical protein PINS_up000697 [Pythium insidiosum]|nr:hypothetical protein PINS_up000697 [Pythium insidiosum]
MRGAMATAFVRHLYRLLDHEDASIISWDDSGRSFTLRDEARFESQVIPRYFRGGLDVFFQHLAEHGFLAVSTEENEDEKTFENEHFVRGDPSKLANIVRVPLPNRRRRRRRTRVTVSPYLPHNSASTSDQQSVSAPVDSISLPFPETTVSLTPQLVTTPPAEITLCQPLLQSTNALFSDENEKPFLMKLVGEAVASMTEASCDSSSANEKTPDDWADYLTRQTLDPASTSMETLRKMAATAMSCGLSCSSPFTVETCQFSDDTMQSMVDWLDATSRPDNASNPSLRLCS